MRTILRVFNYEFRRHGQRGGYLFMTIGVPLIAVGLFFGFLLVQQISNKNARPEAATPAAPSSQTRDDNALPIGVVDQTSQHILTAANLGAPYEILPDAASASTAMQQGTISSYILLPADYLQSGTVEFWLPRFSAAFSLASTADIGNMLRKSIAASTTGLDAAALARLTERAPDVINHRLDVGSNQSNQTAGFGASYALVYIFALALVFSTFLTSGYLMQAVMEERQNRVIEVLMASLRPGELLAGKVLALGTLGLIQMGAWAVTAFFLIKQLASTTSVPIGLDVTVPQLVTLLAFFIAGYLMYAAVYAGIGTIANNLREGPQFAVFFTLPAMLPLYLIAVFTLQPDGPLAVALSLFPITAPLAMVMRVAISPVPAWQIVLSWCLLLLTGFGFMWISARLFRVTVLLSGQTPRPRDIPRLLRQSL